MNREEIIQKVIVLAEKSPMRHMFEQMPWWNNWTQLSDPGLQKVLETLDWHRSEIEEMVTEVITTNPEARQEAYGYVRHAQMVDIQAAEQKEGDWTSDSLLATI